MVDVRPLIFITILSFMLLLTAGFAKITHQHHNQTSSSYDAVASEGMHSSASTSPDEEGTPWATTTEPEGHSTPVHQDSGAVAPQIPDSDIFADTPPAPPLANEQTGTDNLPSDQPAEMSDHQDESSVFADQVPSNNEAVPGETPRVATARPEEEISRPIANKAELDQVTMIVPEEIPAAPTTGKLIIRSNVSNDVVLIDGKPYGKTRLEVTLKPGNYQIEVAKPGYESWKGQASVVAGKTNTIIARLKKYAMVEYRNGVWKGGIVTGEGIFVDSDGTEYTGSFVNKRFHGKGTIRYPDGTKYTGEWFEGKMQGQGSLTLPNGDTYIGEFRDDQFNGDGTLTKANGDIYSGFWVNGALNGEGSLTTKDGLLYVGGFANNQFHGNGNLTYPDGTHYEGSFSNGKYHGKGVLTFPNGKQYSGQFMDNQFHGQGELLNPNGSKITGTFKFGKPYGKATLTTPEGEVFTARTSEPGVCYREKSYRATTCPPMDGW